MMIMLSENTLKYLKRESCIKSCIKTFIICVCMYTIIEKVNEHEQKINNLTKQIKELNKEGD